jgi:hypothetical protein
MSAIFSFDTPDRRPRPGVAAGIAVSLALHALLLFAYRLPADAPAPPPGAKVMTVWLQPPKPPVAIAKVEPPPPVRPAPRQRRAPAPAATRSAAISTSPTLEQPAVAAQAPVQSPATPAPDPLYPDQQPKQFDMNEALKIARKVAKEKDPAKAGTLTAQLEAHPLYAEPAAGELAKKIDAAKRPDCKNTGAGLLSPLIWLLDKKDHGCKF